VFGNGGTELGRTGSISFKNVACFDQRLNFAGKFEKQESDEILCRGLVAAFQKTVILCLWRWEKLLDFLSKPWEARGTGKS
jgi:hypothetical protein